MADIVYEIRVSGLGGGEKFGENLDTSQDNIDKPQKVKLPSASLNTKNILNSVTGKRGATATSVGAGLYLANRVANAYIQTIGLRTGNSYMQESVQFGLGMAMSIGTSTIAGAQMGGILGATIGLGVGVVKTGIDALISEYQAGIKRDWNIASASERQRVMNYASYGNNRLGGALY